MTINLKYLFPFLFLFLTSFNVKEGKKINIIFIGDSITEGGALANPSADATPILVEQHLKTLKLFSAVRIANMGFSGHTTVDFLPESNTDFLKVLAAANTFALDKEATLIFSIMLGTNDSANFGPNGSPVSAENYKANLKLIIDSLLEEFPTAIFILQYPLWYSSNTYNNSSYLQEGLNRLHKYSIELSDLVEQYQINYSKQVFAGDRSSIKLFRKNYKNLYKPENGKEGIFYLHPNAEGSKVLSKIWANNILNIINN